MGTPGIQYFPLDCNPGTEIELIEAEFGLTGFGVVVKLWQEIYAKRGYYIEWTNEVALLFARKIGLGGGVVSEIVRASVKRGIFDKGLFDKYQILTSKGIQKRYFEAVNRRKQIEVIEPYLLVEVAQICRNVDISFKNGNISAENANISEQRKGEERKGNKRKEKKYKRKETETESNQIHYAEFVNMTEEEYAKLVEKYGEAPAKRMIEILDNYKGASNKTYASDYRAILSWVVGQYFKEANPFQSKSGKEPKNYDGEMW